MSLRVLAPQITKFLLTGGLAAVANLATGWALRLVLSGSWGHAAAVAAGVLVGTVVSFVLNRWFTFQATEGDLKRQVIRYLWATLGYIAIQASIDWLLELALHSLLGSRVSVADIGLAAHAGAVGLTTIYSFLVIKYFALRVPAKAKPS